MISSKNKLLSMHTLATLTLLTLAIGTMAIYLPMLYEKLFLHQVGKTHLLFSPVTKRFIYTEKIVGTIPPESYAVATDHTADYAYRDQNGTWYTRVEFEKRLPFIYYKNMELWGLLPIEIDGTSFDKTTIKKMRQVWELKQQEVTNNTLTEQLWPLLESNPGQVRLSFPGDRFRMTKDRMEFVDIATNSTNKKLTGLFTDALKAKGFSFPARSVNGKFTVLKPFDEGVFLVDNNFRVFHLKRINNKPVVRDTGIAPKYKTRKIKVNENRKKEYYGFLLANTGNLFLISYDNYKLIPLPLAGYLPDTMDVKLVMNPLYNTAIYSNDATVHGVAMDLNFNPIASYQHQMSRTQTTIAGTLYTILFPFCIKIEHIGNHGPLKMVYSTGGVSSMTGIVICLVFACLLSYLKNRTFPEKQMLFLISLSGIYGLIILLGTGTHSITFQNR